MTEKAEIGLFPALLEPAQQIAEKLQPGQKVQVSAYPEFWVAHKGDMPGEGHEVGTFSIDAKEFVIYEFLEDEI